MYRFNMGIVFGMGWIMAYQDWLGKEEYLRYASEHWLNSHWGVGVGIMIVAFIAGMIDSNRLDKKRS